MRGPTILLAAGAAVALSACTYVERERLPAPQATVVVPQQPAVVTPAQPAPTVTVRPSY